MSPPPSPLAIATSSITRLLKEERSYERELLAQQKRLADLEKETESGGSTNAEEGNDEFQRRQENQAIEETKAVFAPLREKIAVAVEKVEGLLSSGASSYEAGEVEAARDAVGRAKGGVNEGVMGG